MEIFKKEITSLINQGKRVEGIKLIRKTYNLALKDAKEFFEEIEKDVLNGETPKILEQPKALQKKSDDSKQENYLKREIVELIKLEKSARAVEAIRDNYGFSNQEAYEYFKQIRSTVLKGKIPKAPVQSTKELFAPALEYGNSIDYLDPKIINLIKQQEKVKAIHSICWLYKLGLKEAKEYYENNEEKILKGEKPFAPIPVSPPKKEEQPPIEKEVQQNICNLIEQNKKIEALKAIREAYSFSMLEAKKFYEEVGAAIRSGEKPTVSADKLKGSTDQETPMPSPSEKEETTAKLEYPIWELIEQGKKIDAIKAIRTNYELNLSEAKKYYEQVEASVLKGELPEAPQQTVEKEKKTGSRKQPTKDLLKQEIVVLIKHNKKKKALRALCQHYNLKMDEASAYYAKIMVAILHNNIPRAPQTQPEKNDDQQKQKTTKQSKQKQNVTNKTTPPKETNAIQEELHEAEEEIPPVENANNNRINESISSTPNSYDVDSVTTDTTLPKNEPEENSLQNVEASITDTTLPDLEEEIEKEPDADTIESPVEEKREEESLRQRDLNQSKIRLNDNQVLLLVFVLVAILVLMLVYMF